jgi:hypothetical protein
LVDLEISNFEENDIDEINAWRVLRGFEPIPRDLFPKNGLIVRGVAAVFIYLTDSSLAMIEGLISNPEAGIIKRARVIKSLVSAAHTVALGLRDRVVVLIENDGVSGLALGLGYKSIGKCELFIGG